MGYGGRNAESLAKPGSGGGFESRCQHLSLPTLAQV
jgi:hypothetical protein